MSRNNGVPPAPPTLAITSTTGSAISLGWTPAPDGGAPLIAYHVHYHREFGDWDRVDVSPRNTSFTLTGLRCGTNYQFYLQVKFKENYISGLKIETSFFLNTMTNTSYEVNRKIECDSGEET